MKQKPPSILSFEIGSRTKLRMIRSVLSMSRVRFSPRSYSTNVYPFCIDLTEKSSLKRLEGKIQPLRLFELDSAKSKKIRIYCETNSNPGRIPVDISYIANHDLVASGDLSEVCRRVMDKNLDTRIGATSYANKLKVILRGTHMYRRDVAVFTDFSTQSMVDFGLDVEPIEELFSNYDSALSKTVRYTIYDKSCRTKQDFVWGDVDKFKTVFTIESEKKLLTVKLTSYANYDAFETIKWACKNLLPHEYLQSLSNDISESNANAIIYRDLTSDTPILDKLNLITCSNRIKTQNWDYFIIFTSLRIKIK